MRRTRYLRFSHGCCCYPTVSVVSPAAAPTANVPQQIFLAAAPTAAAPALAAMILTNPCLWERIIGASGEHLAQKKKPRAQMAPAIAQAPVAAAPTAAAPVAAAPRRTPRPARR